MSLALELAETIRSLLGRDSCIKTIVLVRRRCRVSPVEGVSPAMAGVGLSVVGEGLGGSTSPAVVVDFARLPSRRVESVAAEVDADVRSSREDRVRRRIEVKVVGGLAAASVGAVSDALRAVVGLTVTLLDRLLLSLLRRVVGRCVCSAFTVSFLDSFSSLSRRISSSFRCID